MTKSVVVLAGKGFGTVAEVADMDLVSFGAACDMVDEISRDEKTEAARISWITSQGTAESVNELTKQWQRTPEIDAVSGNEAFLAKFPQSVKRG